MSGQLNKEQQVQVVIRLKPVSKDSTQARSVYVSDQQQKTLIVETPNKKEYFVFDNIADEQCTQQQIYEYIGQDAVKSSTDGYNCCIFAYGQTGAGKTYSILGNSQEILNDYYTEERGILPRLLSDLFSWCSNETDRFWIKCSYLEIYNEQIIDLLNPELKLRQIRQDFKKGVYVQGLSEENATNYEESMNILMRGVKNRKTSATSMNDESSRSHTIFTLNIQSEFMKNQVTKIRRSKINIVDLAGSERAKQTKVEGQRLKEGCNINKSLHVLGNVINALVQSAKKKKHVPFRDSKLTHFLKDSLCGNSITKLLANIHPSKSYLGDTLSTLMFAKRAKILKMKVQVNENLTQNFQQLRKQIRKLRQQLAQARYIKNEEKPERNIINESENDIVNMEKQFEVSNFDNVKHQNILQVFEDNEIHYKGLIQVYEEHMKVCGVANRNKKSMNMHQQWKNMEKKNQSLRNIVKYVPAFTKIFKQNIQLKNQIKDRIEKSNFHRQQDTIQNISILKLKQDEDNALPEEQIKIIRNEYQNLLRDIQSKFTAYIKQVQTAYEELQNENRAKDERIKDLRKRKELPPDLQELANQNQYLKLNIMQLQDEINILQEKERRLLIQIKQLKKEKQKQKERDKEKESQSEFFEQEENIHVNKRLIQIRASLENQIRQYETERNEIFLYIDSLKQKLLNQIEQSKLIHESSEALKVQNKGLKKKLNSLLKINNQLEISKDQNTYTNTFWTNQQSNLSEELELFKQEEKNKNSIERDENSRFKLNAYLEEQRNKGIELSNQIIKLHKCYNQEISKLKQEINSLQKARKSLSEENFNLANQLRKWESAVKIDQRKERRSRNLIQNHQLIEVQPSLIHMRSTTALQKGRQPPSKISYQKYDYGQKNAIGTLSKKNILIIRQQKEEKQKKSSM